MRTVQDLYKKYGVEQQSNNNGGGSSSSSSSTSSSSDSIFHSSTGRDYENEGVSYNSGWQMSQDIQQRTYQDKETGEEKKLTEYQYKSFIRGEIEKKFFDRKIEDAACNVNDFIDNAMWTVDMDINGDGTIEDGVAIADAIALSFDSELDLYIQDALESVFEKYNCYKLIDMFGDENSPALADLARLGIRADAIGDDKNWQNRTYTFSLVKLPENADEMTDEELIAYVNNPDAEIIEDPNGKKGSIIFADGLIGDGMAQGAELNLSSILDTMGYECISKADFLDNPDEYYQLLSEIHSDLQSGNYTTSGNFSDIYGDKTLSISDAVRAVHFVDGSAPGSWSLNNSYEDVVAMIEKAKTNGRFSYGGGGISQVGGSAKTPTGVDGTNPLEKEGENKKNDYDGILEDLINDYTEREGKKPEGSDLKKLEEEARTKSEQ